MDELELLKKDWQKDTAEYPQLSAEEIYPMILKKSSSLVKWIFYISIAELVFWILMNTLPFLSESYKENFDKMEMSDTLFYGLNIFSYAIICVFIYFLYTAYRSISVVDTAKGLMKNILRTRKIVNYYVIYNLVFLAISSIIAFYYTMIHSPEFSQQLTELDSNGEAFGFWMGIIFVLLLTIAIFGLVIWGFYRLIYGILLKRLNRNYKELKKLET